MQQMHNKKLVVVLGMHRSGTSAVTRSLKALGVDLGNTLVPPVAGDNDRGFWEDADTLSVNQDLMAALGVDWCPLGPYSWSKIDANQRKVFEQQATDLLRNKLSMVGAFGIKDPRLTRLLPFWRPIFDRIDADVRYVLVVRNPLSVAASLKRRNGFADFRSLLLWLRHVVPSFLDTYGLPRVVVSYERMMVDPREQLQRIADRLDLFFDEGSQAYADYVHDFLSVELQHAHHQTDELGQSAIGARAYLRPIYEALEAMASDRLQDTDPSIRQLFLNAAGYLTSFEDSLAYIEQLEARNERLRLDVPREMAQRLAQLESAYDTLAEGQAWLDSQREAWKELAAVQERRIDELSALVAEIEKGRAELESAYGALMEGQAWLRSQKDAWEELALIRERRIDELSALVKEMERARMELESAYDARSGAEAWFRSQRDAWEQQAAASEQRIGELSSIVAEYEKDKVWLESQRQAWETRSKQLEAQLVDVEQHLSGQK